MAFSERSMLAFEAATAAGRSVVTTASVRHREAWQAFAPDATCIGADETARRERLSS